MELKNLKGVGPSTIKKLNNAGIYDTEDLLRWYPRDYVYFEPAKSISEIQEEETVTVYGSFSTVPAVRRFGGKTITSGTFRDASGSISVSWYSMPYIAKSIGTGKLYLRGKVVKKKNTKVMYQPSILMEDQYLSLLEKRMPVYPLKTGLTNKLLTSLISQCLNDMELVGEYLPYSLRERYHLADSNYAIRNIHFPEDLHDMMIARKRLVFDEFFFFMLSVRELKEQTRNIKNTFPAKGGECCKVLLESFPYRLTKAQQKTLTEVYQDMESDHTMNRLVQGDVGSGKTVIAMLAMVKAAENGYQSALMVPTEVLARQHYESFLSAFDKAGIRFPVILLTGSMTASAKRKAYEQIASTEGLLVIGTHALIQEKVKYKDLGLVITDEQHRFGVNQRSRMTEKTEEKGRPHVLVMSATPIPRTLALILYGDLDISVIDELPANRKPIKNCVVDESWLKKAYLFIENEVKAGHQAYIICPMVEESEAIDAENVQDYTQNLKKVLPESIRIACLHGRMKAKEKNEIMELFAAHEIDVLVSTTVVEVGVNVPNATVMMIENAERFGLAQLHQLRGRVGRGDAQSYCIFMDRSDHGGKSERLRVLEKSNDGFFIASEDLRLRGPGDFYGVRQNGRLEFELADIYTDSETLKAAREAADFVSENRIPMTKEESDKLYELLKKYEEKASAQDVAL